MIKRETVFVVNEVTFGKLLGDLRMGWLPGANHEIDTQGL